MPIPLYPLRFVPVLKRAIWGGERLVSLLDKEEAEYAAQEPTPLAESWEVSAHPSGTVRVANGPLRGTSLAELVAERPEELLGKANATDFPLLLKYIDAAESLSVQVHPGEAYVEKFPQSGAEPKSEAWYILEAPTDSVIYAGLKEGVTRDSFTATGDVASLLHSFQAKPGQVVNIPAGTVHAIGAGVLIVEIQQTSDTTFRLYDWGRVTADGKPRPLHAVEALEAIDFSIGPVSPNYGKTEQLANGALATHFIEGPIFSLSRYQFDKPWTLPTSGSCQLLTLLQGETELVYGDTNEILRRGDSVLLPANIQPVELIPSQETHLLLSEDRS